MLGLIRFLEKLKTRLPKDPWELPGHIWLEIPISSWEPFWNLLCAELRNGALDLEMVPWTSKWSPGLNPGTPGGHWQPFPKEFRYFRLPGSLSGASSASWASLGRFRLQNGRLGLPEYPWGPLATIS